MKFRSWRLKKNVNWWKRGNSRGWSSSLHLNHFQMRSIPIISTQSWGFSECVWEKTLAWQNLPVGVEPQMLPHHLSERSFLLMYTYLVGKAKWAGKTWELFLPHRSYTTTTFMAAHLTGIELDSSKKRRVNFFVCFPGCNLHSVLFLLIRLFT